MTLEGLVVNRYPSRRITMIYEESPLHSKNWVWCLKCLEWVDTNKVSYVNIEEDIHGIDNMTFICDKCGQESKSKVIAKETQPRSR